MPRYKKEVNRLIEIDEVNPMIQKAKRPGQKVAIALEYITGARPAELIELKKRNFRVVGSDLQIIVPTKKGGLERVLPFDIESTPYVKELVVPYIQSLPEPDSFVLPFRTTTRLKQLIYETSNGKLCPYNFRHNRLSQLGLIGASLQELMNFKGARDAKSVIPYLYRNPAALDGLKRRIK